MRKRFEITRNKQLNNEKEMKKGLITTVIIAAVVLGGFFWIKNVYNQMVVSDENVQAAWSQVENDYQRRADLIQSRGDRKRLCGA